MCSVADQLSRHVHISAASTHVGPAGEESVAASPGVGDAEGAAATAAAALADDESDDEADREVGSCQFTSLAACVSKSSCILHMALRIPILV